MGLLYDIRFIMEKEKLLTYIEEIIGKQLILVAMNNEVLNKMPFLFRNNYDFYNTELYGKKIVLILLKEEILNVGQFIKQVEIIQQMLKEPIALVTENISSVIRKRFIDNKISFIVPGKQLYLAPMLIHLQNNYTNVKTTVLLPSAQVLILYHILHRNDLLENYSFKELAEKFRYTQMGITKAVRNLEDLELIDVEGSKEKKILFKDDIPVLWKIAESYLVNPVLKIVYTNRKPENLLKTGYVALEEYTDMNPGNQTGFAIEKNEFYLWEKREELRNIINDEDGAYFLEVWKYNPILLANGVSKKNNVDPLSLYLIMKDKYKDERTEMALDQIIKNYIW